MRLALGLVLAGTIAAQSDPWAPLRFIEGKWQGKTQGQQGKGVSTRVSI